ncbi:hypothetical protein [Cupriavidus necator]|uniref:hypothetical protein n=1 Tax=Cupriavidus necator TaxID=106590 RepID=UPI0009C1C47D|nr:hypothetical protein [Cupriavidus necator]
MDDLAPDAVAPPPGIQVLNGAVAKFSDASKRMRIINTTDYWAPGIDRRHDAK